MTAIATANGGLSQRAARQVHPIIGASRGAASYPASGSARRQTSVLAVALVDDLHRNVRSASRLLRNLLATLHGVALRRRSGPIERASGFGRDDPYVIRKSSCASLRGPVTGRLGSHSRWGTGVGTAVDSATSWGCGYGVVTEATPL